MKFKPGDNVPFAQLKVGDLVLVYWKDAYVGEGKKDFEAACHAGFVYKKGKAALHTSCIPCAVDAQQHNQVDVVPKKMIDRVVLLETGVQLKKWFASLFMVGKLPEWWMEAMGYAPAESK